MFSCAFVTLLHIKANEKSYFINLVLTRFRRGNSAVMGTYGLKGAKFYIKCDICCAFILYVTYLLEVDAVFFLF